MLRVFNTLSRTKEEFVPRKEDEVGMYVCGPTTYNFIHLGNARPMVVLILSGGTWNIQGIK